MYIFISHSSTDFKVAEEICVSLEKEGHKCFLAPRDIRSGYQYAEEIMNGIERSDVMLLLMSKQSNQSPHVLREVERAVSKQIPIIVYKLEEVVLSKAMEYFLMSHQWVSAGAGASHSTVVKCVTDYEKERSEVVAKLNTAQKSEKKSHLVLWLSLLFAVVLLALVILFIFLSKKEDVEEKQETGMEQELIGENKEPATEKEPAVRDQENDVEQEPIDEQNQPEQSEPEQNQPEQSDPEQNEPEQNDPEQNQPEQNEPEQSEPEQNQPEQNQPEQDPIVEESTTGVEIGDIIVFGSYNGEPIEWRVLKVSADTNTAVIVSKHILTMKSFDVAESGSYNYYNGQDYWFEDVSGEDAEVLRQIHGDNDWTKSNIRTWLNSAKENVKYEDQKPLLISTSEYKNGYDTEPGFLNNFSEEERGAILETEIKTNGKITMDKVFLLSTEELVWFEDADVSLVTTPTMAAREQDTSDWYEVNVSSFGVEDYCWWLRDSDPDGLACEAYLVGSSYSGCTIYTEIVGLEGYGIRPAMTIDLSVECFEVK